MTKQDELNRLLFESASNGNFAEIKRLLTDQNLEVKANIHYFNDACLTLACERGDIHIINYLLTAPELTEHAHLHADNYQPFKALCVNKQFAAIEYLIFEYNFKLNEEIEYFLDKMDMSTIIKPMFERAEAIKNFHDELTTNLPHPKQFSTKIKI